MSPGPVDEETRVLLERIKQRLPDRPIREVAMFGAIAVMVDDSMVVAVGRDRSLLARVMPVDDRLLVKRDDAARAEMGAGRSMGIGWIRVDPRSIEDEATLDVWLDAAIRRLHRQDPTARR